MFKLAVLGVPANHILFAALKPVRISEPVNYEMTNSCASVKLMRPVDRMRLL
jgi:hypothetical protein